MRLIDVDALPDDCAWCSDSLIEAINEAPTIDAVPREKYDRLKENAEILSKACDEKEYVVRCKDCKHWHPSDYCTERDGLWYENDFCAYGERGEENGN